MKTKKAIVIGAGFSSLAASSYLAKSGYTVSVVEKNDSIGGRARQFKKLGYTFDMGPTFYWMPDVFENYFADFNKKTSNYYDLKKLNPAYEVFFKGDKSIKIDDDFTKIKSTFENIEKGSGKQLDHFINNAQTNYSIAISDLVFKPGESIFEIANYKTIARLNLFFSSIRKRVRKSFKNENLQKILEFPVLFLGAKPKDTPAFYNFMNYADLKLGTWHPMGGMYEVVNAMISLNEELDIEFITNCSVQRINTENNKVNSILTSKGTFNCDILLSGADYQHTEQLLAPNLRQYSEKYWESRTFAPSALLFYVAFDKKLKNISHHSLFFDTDFEEHSKTIYDTKEWPNSPLFYASFPSINDDSCAPPNCESGTFLIPIAPGIEDTEEIREIYFEKILQRLEEKTKQDVKSNIVFKKSYCISDFTKDYNSFKGNAYGLANTLFQTHILRPRLKSKKVDNLYFTGQLTLPGPGVPPSLISGKIVSHLINKYHPL